MINFKTGLSKKEKELITSLVHTITDVYGDFYITQNNLRLFIKENLQLVFDNLKKGDKIIFDEKGMVLVVGFSDKAKRKYLKILTSKPNEIDNYFKVLNWNIDCDLFIKIKKNNPLKASLIKNGFTFAGGRGKEILLKKENINHA